MGTFFVPRFDAPPSYHDFADKREIAGIPHFGDVVSNVAFLAAGICGTIITLRRRHHFQREQEITPYLLLFTGIALTAFGSGYYHLDPTDERLFWDRLPMTVAFMALLAAIISERMSVNAGNRLLPFLVACGAASLLYWRWSVHTGDRDLRPYALVQGYPLVAIILLIWLFPRRYTRGHDYLVALGFYVAAKVFELADKRIFHGTGDVISGHTLKHIAAAVGGYWPARMLLLRKAVPKETQHTYLWKAANRP